MRQFKDFKFDNSANSLDKFKKFIKNHDCPELTLNLSSLNIFDATKFVLLSSAYHYQKYPSGNYNSSSRLEFVKITGRQIQAIAFDAAGNLIAAATDGSNAGYYL